MNNIRWPQERYEISLPALKIYHNISPSGDILWSCSDGKEMYKKAWYTCRVVVLPIQPIALPTDRAPPNPFIR